MQQHIMQISIKLLLENGVDLDNNASIDPMFIKGLNRGVLIFLNEVLNP